MAEVLGATSRALNSASLPRPGLRAYFSLRQGRGQPPIDRHAARIVGIAANGKEFPIEVSISRVETHGGVVDSIILRDVTERERALQALRESEQLKASILDSLSSHVAVVDSSGIVVAVTEPKFDFAVGNRLLLPQVGANYFEICGSKNRKRRSRNINAGGNAGGVRWKTRLLRSGVCPSLGKKRTSCSGC